MLFVLSCEIIDDDFDKHWSNEEVDINLRDVAHLLSSLPLTTEQMGEVYDAVNSSSVNGYDEEYMMVDIFETPGQGVGDSNTKSGGKVYETPLRDLILEYVAQPTKSCACDMSFVNDLMNSSTQIYWPYSEDWDGETLPVITFDPDNGSDTNLGYKVKNNNGQYEVEEIVVDEDMAKKRPVWVVNNNTDSSHKTLEILKKEGHYTEGGEIIVNPKKITQYNPLGPCIKSSEQPLRTLLLKSFTMKEHYDPWFAGASEFFVKIGSVENFTASTEAELKLYVPTITDFMVVVKRRHINVPQDFNAILVSDWSDQVTECAFMIVEDDGGKKTSWSCTALVRIASKSYGIEISLPYNQADDIVWRGQLSARFLKATSKTVGHFGDVDLTFEFKEY